MPRFWNLAPGPLQQVLLLWLLLHRVSPSCSGPILSHFPCRRTDWVGQLVQRETKQALLGLCLARPWLWRPLSRQQTRFAFCPRHGNLGCQAVQQAPRSSLVCHLISLTPDPVNHTLPCCNWRGAILCRQATGSQEPRLRTRLPIKRLSGGPSATYVPDIFVGPRQRQNTDGKGAIRCTALYPYPSLTDT